MNLREHMQSCSMVFMIARLVVAFLLAPAAGVARAEPQPLSEVFARVDPAVVEIHPIETDLAPAPMIAQPVSVSGLGSGVLISPDGKILTAAHVVQTADDIEVQLQSGERLKARVVSSETTVDIALLQLEKPPRVPVAAEIGDSDAVKIGEQVFVVGAPLGVSHTLTVGYISGRRRPNDTFRGILQAEFFQTDAAINQGNSGGPLFNMRGEVVGIVSYIMSRSGGSDGLGFAVTSKVARQILETKSFWSGLNGYMLSGELAQVFNVPSSGIGLLVERVGRGSPSDRMGLKAGTIRAMIGEEELIVGGDIIMSVMGISLSTPSSLALIREKITALKPGDPVTVIVLRGGRMVELASTVPQEGEAR